MTRSSVSLRDPAGSLVAIDGRFFRFVLPLGATNAHALEHSPVVARWQREGRFVATQSVPRSEWPEAPGVDHAVAVLEHAAIAFPSYPEEWTPSMLADAGALTAQLARELLAEGLGLKDATPLNVLFDGCTPVFVDALSVEPRDPGDAVWFAYGQFVRTFVLPLLASKYLGWSLRRTFTGARDGLEPEMLYPRLSRIDRLRAPVFAMVTGPVLLSRRLKSPAPSGTGFARMAPERAKFSVERLLNHAARSVERARGSASDSRWTSYRDSSVHPPEYHEKRRLIVEEMMREHHPARVLDIGTNDGTFALVAAAMGAAVVAIDRDEAVVERAYRRIKTENANILPLVVDLLDPTPAAGWRNEERQSFLQRATNGFDAVLCLAVLHHLVAGDWIPLEAAFDLVAELTRDLLVIEFIPADDPHCAGLLRGRQLTADRWSVDALLGVAHREFDLVARQVVSPSGREVFVLRRRSPVGAG